LKKAKDITALVTAAGSEVMKRLVEQLDPNKLLCLKIDELHALLVNVDPQGFIYKPIKKTRQEKVSLLPTFQAVLGFFLAVVTTSPTQAVPLLPIPFAPGICEGKKTFQICKLRISLYILCLFLTRYLRMRRMHQPMFKHMPRTRKVARM
jgi:hypothetical protein